MLQCYARYRMRTMQNRAAFNCYTVVVFKQGCLHWIYCYAHNVCKCRSSSLLAASPAILSNLVWVTHAHPEYVICGLLWQQVHVVTHDCTAPLRSEDAQHSISLLVV